MSSAQSATCDQHVRRAQKCDSITITKRRGRVNPPAPNKHSRRDVSPKRTRDRRPVIFRDERGRERFHDCRIADRHPSFAAARSKIANDRTVDADLSRSRSATKMTLRREINARIDERQPRNLRTVHAANLRARSVVRARIERSDVKRCAGECSVTARRFEIANTRRAVDVGFARVRVSVLVCETKLMHHLVNRHARGRGRRDDGRSPPDPP